jgi:hypothetical protein
MTSPRLRLAGAIAAVAVGAVAVVIALLLLRNVLG